MGTAKVSITKLNSKNYPIWATQIEELLPARGLWNYIEREISTGASTQGTTKNSLKMMSDDHTENRNGVRAAILCTIEPDHISMIAGDKDQKWCGESLLTQIHLNVQLHYTRFEIVCWTWRMDKTKQYVNMWTKFEQLSDNKRSQVKPLMKNIRSMRCWMAYARSWMWKRRYSWNRTKCRLRNWFYRMNKLKKCVPIQQ